MTKITVRLLATAVAVVGVFAAATTASANSGNGPVPPATSSDADAIASVGVSNGTTPVQGLAFGYFEKGSETYTGSDSGIEPNNTTTVVDFTLPQGVTLDYNPTECGSLNNGGYCIIFGIAATDYCTPSTGGQVVSVNGNTIEFRLACAPGQSFEWEALVDSLLTNEGSYDMSVQFKTGELRRAKDAPNMWQILLPGVFDVSGLGCSCVVTGLPVH